MNVVGTLKTTGHELAEDAGKVLGLTDPLGETLFFAFVTALATLAALWLAMWFQFDAPYWAASTVLITSQASRPKSLLKAVNRLLGTLIGVVAGLVIEALFPQGWWSFALAISTWLALCTFVAVIQRELQAYAAALSGYTAVIVVTEAFPNANDAFNVALSRGGSVVLGVTICVLVDLLLLPAKASRTLHKELGAMLTKVRATTVDILRGHTDVRACTDVLTKLTTFDTLLEEAATDGLWPSGAKRRVRRATLGLIDALMLAIAAARPGAAADREALADRLERGASDFYSAIAGADLPRLETRREPTDLARALLASFDQARAGTLFLTTGRLAGWLGSVERAYHRDVAGAAYAALRTFVGVLAACAFWILTRWDFGSSFVLIVGILCCLAVTRASPTQFESLFAIGTSVAAVVALVLGFFVLPLLSGFTELAIVLFPAFFLGAFGLKSKVLAGYLTPLNFLLLPMMAVTNEMTYDPLSFFASVLAIIAACLAALVLFFVVPPFSDRLRALALRQAIRWDLGRAPARTRRKRRKRRLLLYDRLGTLMPLLPEPEAGRLLADVSDHACRSGLDRLV